jgi:hypothetical protein
MRDGKTYQYTMIDGVDLTIPGDAVEACSQPGRVDDAVAYWVKRIAWPKGCEDAIRRHLKDYGAWTAEQLADDAENRERLLFVAAGEIKESEF